MKKPLFLLFMFFCCVLFIPAQAVIQDVRFVPPVFFVGDPVVMYLDFRLEKPLAAEAPDVMPEADWIDIHDVKINAADKNLSVIISFTPFAPGTRALPSINLGGLQLKDIKIPTHSLLTKETEGVRALRGQLLLPGTRLALALVLAFAAMAPFIGFGLVRFFVNQVKRINEAWKLGKPARSLNKVLKSLKSRVETDSAAQWYSELTDELRSYMSAKTGRDCRSSTTAEIALMKEFLLKQDPGFILLNVLKDGDMVKFAGQYADKRSLNRALETVSEAVKEWEKNNERTK